MKTLIASVLALSLASGAALAQEADAQNRIDGFGGKTTQIAPRPVISGQVGSYSVQHQLLTVDPQLSAADGGN